MSSEFVSFQNVCGSDFKIYLEKWNVDSNAIPDCCWPTYRKSTCGTQIEIDVIAENDVNADSLMVSVFCVFMIVATHFAPTGSSTHRVGHVVGLVLFTLELCLRFISCPHNRWFFLAPITILDILSLIGIVLVVSELPRRWSLEWLTTTLVLLRVSHAFYLSRRARPITLDALGHRGLLVVYVLYVLHLYPALPSGPPCSEQQGHRLQARHKIRCL